MRAAYLLDEGALAARRLQRVNLNILDVHGETVYRGSILVCDKRIVALNPDAAVVRVREVFDGQGLYANPGLIDAHLHFESQLAHPTALAEAMVSCRTTTIYAECLDLLSAAGENGATVARELFRDYDKLPYRLLAFAPGKKTPAAVTRAVLDTEPVIGLGEFEYFTHSAGNQDDFRQAARVREKHGFMNGHWGLTALSDMILNYLPAIGVSNNHDVWTGDDIEKSIRYGFPAHIKFGVGSSEVIKTLLRAIVDRKFPTDNFMLCTDNISIARLRSAGHMDWIVSLCADMGMSPIKAIRMATYNTARSFHMEDRIGSLTPGRFADIVLTDSLSRINPRYVFKDGELIARDRKLLRDAPDRRYRPARVARLRRCPPAPRQDRRAGLRAQPVGHPPGRAGGLSEIRPHRAPRRHRPPGRPHPRMLPVAGDDGDPQPHQCRQGRGLS